MTITNQEVTMSLNDLNTIDSNRDLRNSESRY